MAKRSAFWEGKCAIITGASSGIGRALAKDLVARGARVGLIARRQEALAEVAREIQAAGGKAECRIADVADARSLAMAVGELKQAIGECDVAIACAGIYRATHVEPFDPAAMQDVMATNLLGVCNLFAAVLPGMIGRARGHLAAVASIAGYLGLAQSGAYCASKAAVITLMQSLRLDLEPKGIGVTTICPGYVDTPMITDEERRTLRGLLTAEDTARRIADAIERGKTEVAFPWGLHFQARGAPLLPWWLYRWLVGSRPVLEEVEKQS